MAYMYYDDVKMKWKAVCDITELDDVMFMLEREK